MERCPKCGNDLRTESAGVRVEGENAYLVQKQYCVNPVCENYAGREVTPDSTVVEEIWHKLT